MEKSVKFGAYLPFPAAPVGKLIEVARINEEAGFDSLWAPDHLLFVPAGIVPEAWTILTAAAMVTKKAILGTCVSDPHRYHPAVLAQKIATVDQLSKGRVVLGLGAGEAMNLDPFGIRWDRPVSRLVEAVMVMRRLWSGEMFDFEGEFWKMKNAFLQIKPFRPRPPIYFGANSPRTLRLTGEMADGWLPLPMSPELYRRRLRLVEEGARAAGRSIAEIDAGIYLYTSIADKAEDAYDHLQGWKPLIAPSPKLLRDAGYEIELPEMGSFSNLLPTGEGIEAFAKYTSLIPREAIIEFSVAGTTSDCVEKIGEYVKAGVKHLLLINLGPDPRRVMEIYGKEIIPRFKEA